MGCMSSTDGKNDFDGSDDFDDEEKESKPTAKLSGADAESGIPEMNINRLGSTKVTQSLKFNDAPMQNTQYQPINSTNTRRGGQNMQPSVLNNFSPNAPKNYDMNQYNQQNTNSPHSDQASTVSKDSSSPIGGIPEHRMMDSHGNVHVNKFYNVTRNHNLSNASKMTDMSEIPSVAHVQNGGSVNANPTIMHGATSSNDNLSVAGIQHMHNLSVASNGLSPVMGPGGHHKMSIDSQTTNGSKPLWDDFSERGSVMTENTSTV